MLAPILLLLQLLSVPDGSGQLFDIDMGDVRNLQFPDDNQHLVVTCPFGNPPLVLMSFSEVGDRLEKIPLGVEVSMLLQIGDEPIRQLVGGAISDESTGTTVIARDSGDVFKRLARSASVAVEIEYKGRSYSSIRYVQGGNGDSEAARFQMMPCEPS